jgi:sodium-dependent dicarboxylate transporter 2/3/5
MKIKRARARRRPAQRIGLWLGPVLFTAVLLFLGLEPDQPQLTAMAAIATLMAVWWITDAIPLAATALLPLVLFPLMGIADGAEIAPVYVNDVIFLFVGGFMIALAMEQWNLHRRIALRIIAALGGSPARLVLSFMLASALLSMWISNTATAIMMLAIGLAVIAAEESRFGRERTRRLTLGLLLGIAYGASIGGVATPVGTPPNLAFFQIFQITYPDADPIGFGQWMLLGLPFSAVMLLVVWVALTQVFCRCPKDLTLARQVIDEERRKLGPWSFAEGVVLTVFVSTALLWIFRNDLKIGNVTIYGWSNLLPNPELLTDGTVAVAMALLLFLIPSRATGEGESASVLDMGVFARIPWHIVLLFGGGFALARGFTESGFSGWIGDQLAGMDGTSPILMVAAITATLSFLTELTSNTATTQIVLPILAAAAEPLHVNPLLLMVPATIAASCAFMMPVATPPNAIIFGSGRITIAQMARIGIVINLFAIIVVTVLFLVIGMAVFGIKVGVVPQWATVPPP